MHLGQGISRSFPAPDLVVAEPQLQSLPDRHVGTSRVTSACPENPPPCGRPPISSTYTCVLRLLDISDFKDTFLFPAAFKF